MQRVRDNVSRIFRECDDLSEAERELVRKYRKLDFRGKKAVRAVTDVLSEKGTDGKK